jgi:hypothetical protein
MLNQRQREYLQHAPLEEIEVLVRGDGQVRMLMPAVGLVVYESVMPQEPQEPRAVRAKFFDPWQLLSGVVLFVLGLGGTAMLLARWMQ